MGADMSKPATRRDVFDLMSIVQSMSLNNSLAVLALVNDDKKMAREILTKSVTDERELLSFMRRIAGIRGEDDAGE